MEDDFYKDAILDHLEKPVSKWLRFKKWFLKCSVDFISGLIGKK